MKYLIGSIKHCNRDRIDIWAKSALKYCSCQVVLLVLDKNVPPSLLELEEIGVKIVHTPTGDEKNIDTCKWERHFKVREYLKTINENDIVLLTDTLDVVFQSDPFEWYENNAKKDLILTSEGIDHINEHWNMGGISSGYKEFVEEIKHNEVINSGIMMGKPAALSNILFHIYILTKRVSPENNQGADQPSLNAILLSSFIRERVQIINTNDGLVLHSAVAGPTEQFIPWGFSKNYKYNLPVFNGKEIINKDENPFCLIHQYNRVKEWDIFFKQKYNG